MLAPVALSARPPGRLDRLDAFLGRPLARALLLACALAGVYLQAHFFFLSESHEVDSYSYWFAAEAVRTGADPYDETVLQALAQGHDLKLVPGDPGQPAVYPYVYPPAFAGAWRVFLPLSPTRTHRLLEICGTLLLGVALLACHRAVRPGRHGGLLFALFTVTLVVNGPAVSSTRLGQVNAALLAAMALATLRYRSGHRWSSAVALAAATLVKLTPVALLLGFGAAQRPGPDARRWRAYTLAFALALAGMVLLTLPWAPAATWIQFWHSLQRGLPWQTEYSLWGWLGVHGARNPALLALRVPLYALGAGLLMLLTWRHLRRLAPDEQVVEGTACAIVLGLLLSPLTWQHHFLFFLLPAYAWISHSWNTQQVLTTLVLAALTTAVLLRLPGSLLIVRPIATLVAFGLVTLGPRRGPTTPAESEPAPAAG